MVKGNFLWSSTVLVRYAVPAFSTGQLTNTVEMQQNALRRETHRASARQQKVTQKNEVRARAATFCIEHGPILLQIRQSSEGLSLPAYRVRKTYHDETCNFYAKKSLRNILCNILWRMTKFYTNTKNTEKKL